MTRKNKMMLQKCYLFLTLMLRGSFHLRSPLTFNPDFTKPDGTLGRRFWSCQTPLKNTYTLFNCYRAWWVLSISVYSRWFLSLTIFNQWHFARLVNDKHRNTNFIVPTLFIHIARYINDKTLDSDDIFIRPMHYIL